MKQLNYDVKTLIMQNVRTAKKNPTPDTYTRSQYRILRKLIVQKKIEKRFFDFIISGLFEKTDWKTLDCSEMYTLIYVLTNYDYRKGEGKNG